MPDIQASQVYREDAPPTGMYYGVSLKVDAAANLFVAWVDFNTANNNDTWGAVRKFNPQGAQVGTWKIKPTQGFKIDDIEITYSGTDLLVALVTHTHTAGVTRARAVEMAKIPGVFVYRQGMIADEGEAGAFIPAGGPDPGGTGMTIEELTAALANANSPLTQTLGKLVKNNARLGMAIELDEKRVLTEQMFGGGQGSFIVYDQLKNTSYTGAKAALDEQGQEG